MLTCYILCCVAIVVLCIELSYVVVVWLVMVACYCGFILLLLVFTWVFRGVYSVFGGLIWYCGFGVCWW